MKIAVRGNTNQFNELRNRISEEHELFEFKNTESQEFDLLFDLEFDQFPNRYLEYLDLDVQALILSCAKVQLEEALGMIPKSRVIGINALPTFIDRPLAEVCSGDADANQALFQSLGWDCRTVDSRTGLVTPRIIFMIINEAYYTVQEGTATRDDIDMGMKLGTAYPKGPFEWCEEIGVKHVYETLSAIYNDTKDERYKICPLLKTEYLESRWY